MRFHDYHLLGYAVVDHGETIQLHLVSGRSEGEKDESFIEFKGVALYHFVHSEAAIITDIEEVPVDSLLTNNAESIETWRKSFGLRLWNRSEDDYRKILTTDSYRAWEISSAIGFGGFVIAKSVA
jgi:hypothetical protein